MKKEYPKIKYHPKKAPVRVKNAEEDLALGQGWYSSPAEFGVETCPGRIPDPVIAAKRAEYEKEQEIPSEPEPAEEPLPAAAKKRGRKPRAA